MLWRADSLEKTLMLGKTEGKRNRGHQRNRGLNGITDSVETNLSKFLETGKDRGAQRAAVHGGRKESDTTEQLNNSQRKISQTWENFSRMLSRSRIICVSTFCNTQEFLAGCFLHLFLPLARAEEVTRQIKRDWASAQESDLFKTPEAVSKWCWQLLRPRAGIWPPPKFPGPPTTPPLAGAAPETRSPRTGPVSPSRQWVCVTPQFPALREGLAHAQTAGSHFDPQWHCSKPPLFGFLTPDWHSLASGAKCRAEDNVDPLWLFARKDFSE